jgi:serine/threonine protein phosphatase PrpC
MMSFHSRAGVGKRQSQNEDPLFPADHRFVVCDGMGDHKAGAISFHWPSRKSLVSSRWTSTSGCLELQEGDSMLPHLDE